MPITVYRRHARNCPYKSQGREYQKCNCVFWADGQPLKQPKSLDTRDRIKALELAREIEISGGISTAEPVTSNSPMTITDCKKAFFDNLTVRNLADSTRRKHETLWRHCIEFAENGYRDSHGIVRKLDLITHLDTNVIDQFMKTWKDGPNARGKKMERLRQFFLFAVSRGWIEKNPMDGMKAPLWKRKQTPPFTPNEMTKILNEAEKKIYKASSYGRANATRAHGLVLFLRYSGLRIIDAVGCQIEWVKDGRVRLIARKNGAHIDVELPPYVIRTLNEMPAMSDLYFFWTGNGKIETAVKDWQGRLLEIFTDAGIQDGHPHRFRDTFAVAMLERGESLQTVADALGDTLAVAQKHYNAWSKQRQSRQDEAVRGSWQNDPVLKAGDKAAQGQRVVSIRKARR